MFCFSSSSLCCDVCQSTNVERDSVGFKNTHSSPTKTLRPCRSTDLTRRRTRISLSSSLFPVYWKSTVVVSFSSAAQGKPHNTCLSIGFEQHVTYRTQLQKALTGSHFGSHETFTFPAALQQLQCVCVESDLHIRRRSPEERTPEDRHAGITPSDALMTRLWERCGSWRAAR